ncbi:hypothetical protein SAMN04489740_1172 [Arthrobacter alpinus]|uniref:Uncharacterized protein n=1 Tax=Arthrobacter alpinus TaxID=656366 RepID=A0A1H5I238_9MICC|nr:hypothetical protein SAMN04489740_1172 [Arthrobacter alpinus]
MCRDRGGYFNVTFKDDCKSSQWAVFSAKCPSHQSLERDGINCHAIHHEGHARYELSDPRPSLVDPLRARQICAESHVEQVLQAQDCGAVQ